MQAHPGHAFEFGAFRLLESERRLFKNGQPLPLSPKVFDTLLVLVEKHGRLVDKDELMSRLWPDSFVEEINLNRSISSLRKALGDTPTKPVFIETVPKCGYRFIAQVIEVAADDMSLIVEKHTSTEIITEEEIQTVDSFKSEHHRRKPVSGGAVTPATLLSKLPSHALVVSALSMLALASVAVYVWAVAGRRHASGNLKIRSVAVLPFKDMSANDDQHLGLSLADVLITRLSNLKDIKVRPTNSIIKFEGQEPEAVAAGESLGVDAVLEGSIYRSKERVRVTARLVRTNDQSPIWSGQLDEDAKDVLAIQSAIAEQVIRALALNLADNEKSALGKRYTEDADAYQLYIRGRYEWNKRSAKGMEEAEHFFRNAIDKDPNFALAYVALADRLATTYVNGARLAIDKALELDPDLGEAYATLGFIKTFYDWEWAEAERSFKKSSQLNPGYATAHHWYATLLEIEGRNDESKAQFQQALEINPQSYNLLADLGQSYYFSRDYGRAEEYCRKALEVYPDFLFAHEYLSEVYLQTGNHQAAFDERLKADLINWRVANEPSMQGERLRSYVDDQRKLFTNNDMGAYLASRIPVTPSAPSDAYFAARIYAFRDEKRKALDSLEEALRGHAFLLVFVKADPVFDSLHSEPRYQAVLRAMDLSRG